MAARPRPARADGDVGAFLARCTHPLRAELDALRAIVARAAPTLVEGVKWNAPSYRLGAGGDDCITFNLSANDRVRIVFHRGAAAKSPRGGAKLLDDDGGLLQWPAPDRAVATFRSLADVTAARTVLARVVEAWVAAVALPAPAALRPRASTGRQRGSSARAARAAARDGSRAARDRRR